MNKVINYSLSSFLMDGGSAEDYYKQWKTPKPLLGSVYIGNNNIIKEIVKIIAIVDKVAIGKVISDDNGGSSLGKLAMYNTTGLNVGWKYGENRPNYRLKEINN